MPTSLAIAANAVRRLLRDRSNLFFVFIFPLLLILLIGATFAGAENRRIAVFAEDVGRLGEQLVEGLDEREGLTVDRYDSAEAATEAVSRDAAAGAVLLPSGYDEVLRSGGRTEVRFVATPDANGAALRSIVSTVVGDQATVLAAARVVAATTGQSFADALQVADATVALAPGVAVDVETVGVDELAREFEGLGQFDLGASQQLLLFVFLTSLTGATALIQEREYGVVQRMLASPVTTRSIVSGLALGRYGVALVQGLYIVIGTLLIFGVDWGDPVASLSVLLAYSLPSAAAGLLLGAVSRNQNQAQAIGIGGGIGLAALGGGMVPLEILPGSMRTVAHVTPHAWGYDAFAEIVRRGGGVTDVLTELGVLVGMGLVLLALAAAGLQRTLTHG